MMLVVLTVLINKLIGMIWGLVDELIMNKWILLYSGICCGFFWYLFGIVDSFFNFPNIGKWLIKSVFYFGEIGWIVEKWQSAPLDKSGGMPVLS